MSITLVSAAGNISGEVTQFGNDPFKQLNALDEANSHSPSLTSGRPGGLNGRRNNASTP